MLYNVHFTAVLCYSSSPAKLNIVLHRQAKCRPSLPNKMSSSPARFCIPVWVDYMVLLQELYHISAQSAILQIHLVISSSAADPVRLLPDPVKDPDPDPS